MSTLDELLGVPFRQKWVLGKNNPHPHCCRRLLRHAVLRVQIAHLLAGHREVRRLTPAKKRAFSTYENMKHTCCEATAAALFVRSWAAATVALVLADTCRRSLLGQFSTTLCSMPGTCLPCLFCSAQAGELCADAVGKRLLHLRGAPPGQHHAKRINAAQPTSELIQVASVCRARTSKTSFVVDSSMCSSSHSKRSEMLATSQSEELRPPEVGKTCQQCWVVRLT